MAEFRDGFTAERTLALFRAHFGAARASTSLLATGATHALVTGVLAGVLAGEVGGFVYATFVFTLIGLLVTMPFFGELGFPMRGEGEGDWLHALPATGLERRVAQLVVVMTLLIALTAPSLAVAAWLAPGAETGGFGGAGQLALVLAGSGFAAAWIGGLNVAQSLLVGSLPGLWRLLQALIGAVSIGGILLSVPWFAGLGQAGPSDLAGLARAWPATWFAAGLPSLAAALGGLVLGWFVFFAAALLPRRADRASVGASRAEGWIEPFARVAERVWVRPTERGAFRFVLEALPKEREFALRVFPLLGLPLAFVWVALTRPPGPEKNGLLALILFTPGFYLPVLASQTCASASAAARWLLECHPTPRGAVENGWFKAVVVRYVLPLHLALGLVAWQQAGWNFAISLALPATLVSILALRGLWGHTVVDLPLSRKPAEVGAPLDLGGPLMGAGVGLALVAALASQVIVTPVAGLGAALGLSLLEAFADYRWRSGYVSTRQTTP